MYVRIGQGSGLCTHTYLCIYKIRGSWAKWGQKYLKSSIFSSKMNYVYTNKPFFYTEMYTPPIINMIKI